MPNPHWHGAFLNDRAWYVVGWLMGLVIALGLLLVVDVMVFQRWLRRGGGLGTLRDRLRRAYGGNVALGG